MITDFLRFEEKDKKRAQPRKPEKQVFFETWQGPFFGPFDQIFKSDILNNWKGFENGLFKCFF